MGKDMNNKKVGIADLLNVAEAFDEGLADRFSQDPSLRDIFYKAATKEEVGQFLAKTFHATVFAFDFMSQGMLSPEELEAYNEESAKIYIKQVEVSASVALRAFDELEMRECIPKNIRTKAVSEAFADMEAPSLARLSKPHNLKLVPR